MKSPDEIKKGLDCCADGNVVCAGNCAFDDDVMLSHPNCVKMLMTNALAIIQQLEKRNRCLTEQRDSAEKTMIEVANRVLRWISVEEKLPKRYEHVLVATRFTDDGEQDVEVAYLAIDRWRKPDGPLYGKVTHWMPLPEPPKE